MVQSRSLRSIFTPAATTQLFLGWVAFGALTLSRNVINGPLSTPVLFTILGAIIAVIVVCAFGVVAQAEHLAHRLGDPYGTLVLTLSIVIIEVILISAVMLGPGEHETIARDSVMAVSMIILNLVVGAALIVGGIRHRSLQSNRTGVSAYLALLLVLLTTALVLPGLIGMGGIYSSSQAVTIALLTIVLYGFFLVRQTGSQRTDFQEVTKPISGSAPETDTTTAQKHALKSVLVTHQRELTARTILLIATVIPIVLLSHDMASLLDEGLDQVGAPVALSGLLIAMIVFLPETITAIRAAHLGQIQRVSNLAHGALVSTVGLTIPAVLFIGLFTGQNVVLAESPQNVVLLAVSLLLTITSFLGKRSTPLHGAAHLMLFALYTLVLFS